ncbi:TetR/AcrR family transcriptional regulator C-terminal domain-containing protein [Arthrobacter gengyunqii]|uniref:Tetracycline repressor TetR C-terminal domain-containing protein n=1 Tax=Arthrobacter gengyunqii TaxID=2886940 RepID=A0ABS8GJU2_9MICC|nr:hypothetical protein [Arthrobacter gengyunqii]MCC3266956.1 hypothetical protein [Arthrobacter gengyunqii]
MAAAGHAYALLDSYVYGFALQEAGLPVGVPDSDPEVVEAMARSFSPDDLPYLAEMAMDRAMQPGYSFGAEFDVGLDIILDGLGRLLKQSASACSQSLLFCVTMRGCGPGIRNGIRISTPC